MTIKNSILDREFDKFVESPTRPGNSSVEVLAYINSKFTVPSDAFAFTVSFPTSSSESYEFRDSYPSGAILKTVTLYYSNSTKTVLIGGEVT
jgi:hypothetical protein